MSTIAHETSSDANVASECSDRDPNASAAEAAAAAEAGSRSETDSPSDEQREPCPTPLSWTSVVRLFEEGCRQHDVDHGGRRLRSWSWGDTTAPAQVLIGGMTTTPRSLALLAHLLRERFHVLVVEDPAIGSYAARDVNDYSSGVLAAADACGVDRFSLFASGWGTLVALNTLLDEPRRAERAVLVGACARTRYSLAERAAFRSLNWLPGRVGSLPAARTLLEQSHRRWFPPFDHSRWEFFVDATKSVPLRTIGARTTAAMRTDLRPRLGDVTQPILLIRPEGEGHMAAARAEELAADLPNVHVEPMHNTGHFSFLTHPHRVAKLVKTFATGTFTSEVGRD